MSHESHTPSAALEPSRSEAPAAPEALPAYEPPRVMKKRSVARATLATGTGPIMGGLMAQG